MDHSYTCSSLQRFLCFMSLVVFLAFAKADAQTTSSNRNETSHSLATFKTIDIHLQQHIQLEIKTSNSQDVKLITSVNGEYKNAVILSSIIRNDSLIITDPIHPTFSFPGDKLSAHKVIDSKATIVLPENKKLVINVQSADLKISGNYDSVYINQLSGSCKIDQLKGDLHFISVYASIYANLKNYDVTSASRSGKVHEFKKPVQIKYFARLETVSGNISTLNKRFN
ncbi:hypothetical protein LY01_00220 [Nonlabens xylanidelens]|uniref:Adhesin n=1 Tax=Nonlabens xylanidelens TaxID=191564 RepID=A0A2S6IQJ2_9FLAO|nr:hypothetical protein [Nonlabens xylanidelens]PPK96400.1 hypothetical protein LY01_00220 [Nonlabens xylanidelens]